MIWLGRTTAFLVLTMISGVLQGIGVTVIRASEKASWWELGGCTLIAISTGICVWAGLLFAEWWTAATSRKGR